MHRFANPARFARMSKVLLPIAALLALVLVSYALYLVFYVAPPDYQQGISVRIMYIHVPAAMLASALYGIMAALSISYLIWRHTLANVIAREAAAIGLTLTAVTLVTGMLWGKPMWGAYWVWDARLTSMLIQLFLYAGYLAVANAGGQSEKGRVAAAWLCIVGAINLPIIKFSVEWWNTLHQPAGLLRFDGTSAIDPSMRTPLLLMLAGVTLLVIALLLVRANAALNEQKIRRLQISKISHKSRA
ncbi:MAG: heme ABC transporter permease [Alphaproteobacteria bacterium]|nr:heme ABC transporter permease [Alphaproteobacteria bacterium]